MERPPRRTPPRAWGMPMSHPRRPRTPGRLISWTQKTPRCSGAVRAAIAQQRMAEQNGEFKAHSTRKKSGWLQAQPRKPSRAVQPLRPIAEQLPRSPNQTHAKVLNKVTSTFVKSPYWENAHEAVTVPDALAEYGQEIEAAFGRTP